MNATNDPAVTTEGLVDQARALKAAIAKQSENLKLIEGKLIELGAGKYAGTDGVTVTVVAPSAEKPGAISYGWPEAEDEERAEEIEAVIRKLTGDHFGKLFARHVRYLPVEGFTAVASAVLTPGKARSVVEICARQGRATSGKAGYVLYPK